LEKGEIKEMERRRVKRDGRERGRIGEKDSLKEPERGRGEEGRRYNVA
jgi:hypothetical protein